MFLAKKSLCPQQKKLKISYLFCEKCHTEFFLAFLAKNNMYFLAGDYKSARNFGQKNFWTKRAKFLLCGHLQSRNV